MPALFYLFGTVSVIFHLWPGGLCVWCGVCKFIGVATAAGCTVLCGLVVVVVLFENSIVCQCTFLSVFFMRHGTFVCCLVVVVVLWCLLFVCTSSLRLHAFFVGVFVWLAV